MSEGSRTFTNKYFCSNKTKIGLKSIIPCHHLPLLLSSSNKTKIGLKSSSLRSVPVNWLGNARIRLR